MSCVSTRFSTIATRLFFIRTADRLYLNGLGTNYLVISNTTHRTGCGRLGAACPLRTIAAGPHDRGLRPRLRLMNSSFFRRVAADHLGPWPRTARADAPRRPDAATRSADLVVLCEELLSGRGEASGVALAREILTRYTDAHHRAAHRLLRGAGAAIRPRSRVAWRRRSLPGRRRRTTRPRPRCIRPPSRAGRNCSAGSILRPAAPLRSCRCASNCSTPWIASRRSRGGGRRFRPPVLVMVQSRLPGAAPHRLVDAGQYPGKDHQARGRAQDPLLGRSAPPHRSARSLLLRLFPSGAGRRAADLRRGGADATGSPDSIAPILAVEPRHAGAGKDDDRGVLLDLQLPARACRRERSAIS